MILHVLDTDILSLYQRGHAGLMAKLDSFPVDELAITVITIEEQLSGWYGLLRKAHQPERQAAIYQRLAEAVPVLARWRILSMPHLAIARYDALKRLGLNVRKMDRRIAAIVLEHGAILVARNVRDFERVPNLIVENWAP